MPRVRRNDPCPCGSGKKYKNCCMRQDRLQESRELEMGHDQAIVLYNALYDYAQSPRFMADLNEAFALYWGGRYTTTGIDDQIEIDDMRRTLEWFSQDYATSTEDRTVLDLFIERMTDGYPDEAIALLKAWTTALPGVFRVLDAGDSGQLLLLDCLRETDLTAHDTVLARNARPGDVLVGRHHVWLDQTRLSYMTLVLPADYEQGLVEYVRNAYSLYADTHYGASWDDFLSETGHIANAYLLSSQAEPLRSMIGPGTRFHDPAVTRDLLRDNTQRLMAEQEQAQREPEPRRAMGHRTASGIILPGAEPKAPQPGRSPVAPKEEEPPERPTILIPGRDF